MASWDHPVSLRAPCMSPLSNRNVTHPFRGVVRCGTWLKHDPLWVPPLLPKGNLTHVLFGPRDAEITLGPSFCL